MADNGVTVEKYVEDDCNVTFALENEDHTLANSLRYMLNKDPHVLYCGYSIPHPNDPVVHIRIQTTGDVTAVEALARACRNLKAAVEHVKTTFKAAVEAKRQQDEPQHMAVDG